MQTFNVPLISSFLIPSSYIKPRFVQTISKSQIFPLFVSKEDDIFPTNNENVFASKDSETETKKYILTKTDREIIQQVYDENSTKLEQNLLQAMPQMSPGLIMTLRQAGSNADISHMIEEQEEQKQLKKLGFMLEDVLNAKLEKGKELLESLLECGEIRKLDSAIGKAIREGQLDMAFLTVLNMNVKDAYESAGTQLPSEEETVEANRLSILQHIYTRCQEEVEKTVDPGVALLNKLLRTSIDSIRYNQLQHYLGKPKSTITTPDGKEIQLNSDKPMAALVTLDQFIMALSNAVQQIRQVENAGGTDRVTAANLVENCRQIAIEARLVIAQEYGKESSELLEFENKLQPIFRPSTPVA